MAVAFDAVASGELVTAGRSFSWTHTPVGIPTGVMVGVCSDISPTPTITVTYGGTSMTSVGTSTNNLKTQLFKLGSPASGAQTVTVTLSASQTASGGSITVTGSDTVTSTMTRTFASATGNSASISVAVTSATGELVIDVAGNATSGTTLTATGTGQTRRWFQSGAADTAAGSSTTGAASVTVSYTAGVADFWAVNAISVKQPAAASIFFDWNADEIANSKFAGWQFRIATQEEDTGLRPIIPPTFERDADYSWNQLFPLSYEPQTEEQRQEGLLPIIPRPGWDDWDWSNFYSTIYAKHDSALDDWVSTPLIPTPFYEDYEIFQKCYSQLYGPQTIEEEPGLRPIIPTYFSDDDWPNRYDLSYTKYDSAWDDWTSIPIIPNYFSEDDWSQAYWLIYILGDDLDSWSTFTPVAPPSVPTFFSNEPIAFRTPKTGIQLEDSWSIAPASPTVGYDDWDWNRSFDVRVTLHEDEPSADVFPIIPIQFFDDWDWSKSIELIYTKHSVELDDWVSAPIVPIQFFDDYAWNRFLPSLYSPQTIEEEPGLIPIALPFDPKNIGWDDYDWKRYFQLFYGPQTVEEEVNLFITQPPPPPIPLIIHWTHYMLSRTRTGIQLEDSWAFVPSTPIVPRAEPATVLFPRITVFHAEPWVFPFPVPTIFEDWDWSKQWQQFWYSLQTSEEEVGLIVAPPPLPTFGWEEFDWNRNFDYRAPLVEEELALFPIIPTFEEWDIWEWNRFLETLYAKYSSELDDWISLPIVPQQFPDDYDWVKYWPMLYSTQTTEEETGNIPLPPPVPRMDWENFDWSQFRDYFIRLSTEEELWTQGVFPPDLLPLAWDDWDWNRNFERPIPFIFTYAEEELFSPFATFVFAVSGVSGPPYLLYGLHGMKVPSGL